MSDFVLSQDNVDPDPHRHVRYHNGMVLGKDDLEQDFAYLKHRDHWSHRSLHGYGTVCGLHVEYRPRDGVHEIVVHPGVALTPRGQIVWVQYEQCSDLEKWMDRRQSAVPTLLEGNTLNLTVGLSYLPRETGQIPIPGEPCRPDSEIRANARVEDDHVLELMHEQMPGADANRPPFHREESAGRAFAQWLQAIEVEDGEMLDDFTTFQAKVRLFLDYLDATLARPPPADPPAPPKRPRVPVDALKRYLREAFRIWVTERRGALRDDDDACTANSLGGQWVRLARLRITLRQDDGRWTLDTSIPPKVLLEDRPLLVHQALLQEMTLGAGTDDVGRAVGRVVLGVDGSLQVAGAIGVVAQQPDSAMTGLYGVKVEDDDGPEYTYTVAGCALQVFSDPPPPPHVFEMLQKTDSLPAELRDDSIKAVFRIRPADGSAFQPDRAGFVATISRVRLRDQGLG